MKNIYSLWEAELVISYFPQSSFETNENTKNKKKSRIKILFKKVFNILLKCFNNFIKPLLMAILIDIIKDHWEELIHQMALLFHMK